MSFFKKLFGKKDPPPWTPPPASPPPPGAPAMMKVWDDYGRLGEIPREKWRTEVLPANFERCWNDAAKLGPLVDSALNDGFILDALEPARQLYRIDHQSKLSASALSFVLAQLEKFDEAEKIVNEAIRQHGKDSLLLNSLAKVHFGRGNQVLVESALWESLQSDPNFSNSFGWYTSMIREQRGEKAELDALHRVAALPGSWRAQLWLARAALHARNLEGAIPFYHESLSRAGKPVPADLLMQMSGDLGKAGHLLEALQQAAPHYVPEYHGIKVDNNLIKAHVDLGQIDAARRLVDQLYAFKRTDWKENLNYWDTEIAKTSLETSSIKKDAPLTITLLAIEGPVWLKPSSPAAELFPASTSAGPTICFLGSTSEVVTNSKRIQHQMSDAPGRMTRALPLFLAEQIGFNSNARVQSLFPWIAGEPGGFVLSGGPWNDADAANYARQGEVKNDYLVVTHLRPNAEPWTVEVRLVRTIDGQCLETLNATFYFGKPEEGLQALSRQVLALLEKHAEVERVTPPPVYQLPNDPPFSYYLLRSEQLLAVRCTGMDNVSKGFLSGEREIIDGNLQLCLDCPQSTVVRILLAQTLLAMKRVRPDIMPEYKDKIARLQKEKPLAEPAQGVVQRLFNEAFSN